MLRLALGCIKRQVSSPNRCNTLRFRQVRPLQFHIYIRIPTIPASSPLSQKWFSPTTPPMLPLISSTRTTPSPTTMSSIPPVRPLSSFLPSLSHSYLPSHRQGPRLFLPGRLRHGSHPDQAQRPCSSPLRGCHPQRGRHHLFLRRTHQLFRQEDRSQSQGQAYRLRRHQQR